MKAMPRAENVSYQMGSAFADRRDRLANALNALDWPRYFDGPVEEGAGSLSISLALLPKFVPFAKL